MAWLEALAQGARSAGGIELAAVAAGFVYVVLAIRSHRACWIAGGISSALYIVVFARAELPMQAALQCVYVALSAWGWRTWRPGGGAGDRPLSWSPAVHALVAFAVMAATAATVAATAERPIAAAAVGDSAGTWASLAATAMLVRRCRESWLWWIAIDLGLAWLFGSQGLAFTSALYLAYAALGVAGWRAWRGQGARP